MTSYNDGLWHGWNGGECPVHPETVVVCVYADGEVIEREADDILWDAREDSERPIAFRVIKEHKEPREFWIWPSGHDVLKFKPHVGGDHYIHVREVIE